MHRYGSKLTIVFEASSHTAAELAAELRSLAWLLDANGEPDQSVHWAVDPDTGKLRDHLGLMVKDTRPDPEGPSRLFPKNGYRYESDEGGAAL